MALLNLKKKSKKENDSKNSKDVPDELPSLPDEKKVEKEIIEEDSEKKEEKTDEKSEASENKTVEEGEEKKLAPDELPPIEEKKLAPDELPQIEEAEETKPEHLTTTPEKETKTSENELYFSDLLKKFDSEGISNEIKKEMLHSNHAGIISKMDKKWKQQEKNLIHTRLEKEILNKMKPLQDIEIEWRQLKTEAFEKEQKIIELEEQISKYTTEIKELIRERLKINPRKTGSDEKIVKKRKKKTKRKRVSLQKESEVRAIRKRANRK